MDETPLPPGVISMKIEDEFEVYLEGRYDIADNGCWLWNRGRDRDGYATGKGSMHRLTYQHYVGPIPEGLQLDHTCEVRHCINPAHLEPVTGFENRVCHYIRRGRTRKDAEWFTTWDMDQWKKSRDMLRAQRGQPRHPTTE